jgi:proteasome lid subunit RPN8/RPN11
MSTKNVKVSSRFEERKLEGNIELSLTPEILEEIRLLHDRVGAIEWSGMLVYKILEGSIEDHKNMKLEAVQVLPMDIGTSGYTEYEISPESDDYTFDNLSRVLMAPDLKMGHIHTHHDMRCFFSGTDTNELHDNAPNHNYYLSLIVNFKDPEEWCAKVVYIGTETQKGTISSSFQGTSSVIQRAFEIDKEVDVMYCIDVNITVPETEYEVLGDFEKRVTDLEEKRKKKYAPQSRITTQNPYYGYYGESIPHQVGRGQMALFEQHVEKDSMPRGKGQSKIDDFLAKLCTLDATNSKSLDVVVNELEVQLGSDVYDEAKDAQLDILIDSAIDNYDTIYAQCFGTEPTAMEKWDINNEVEVLGYEERFADKEIFCSILFSVL